MGQFWILFFCFLDLDFDFRFWILDFCFLDLDFIFLYFISIFYIRIKVTHRRKVKFTGLKTSIRRIINTKKNHSFS